MRDEEDIVTGEFEAVPTDDDGNLVVPKVTSDWLWAMDAAVAPMRTSDRFEVSTEATFRPVPDVLRDHIETAAGMIAAPTVASFFSVTDGYELEWSYRDEESDEMLPGGRVHIFGFAEVFGTWLGTLWGEHPEDADEAAEDFTWELRGLDAGAEDDDYMTVMHVPEKLPTYNLFWHSPHGKTYRLHIGFLDYLRCLTETRGLHGWQYMVVEPTELVGDSEAIERIEECGRLMEKLFPDVDLSGYTTQTPIISDEEE